jgi:hypothetical protein
MDGFQNETKPAKKMGGLASNKGGISLAQAF